MSERESAGGFRRKSAPYDQRNLEDFKLISKSIAAALEKIDHDASIPATEKSLAELAGCSRGTLRNREWPLARLKLIKEDRGKKVAEKRTPKSKPKSNYEELIVALKASRTEAATWFDKYRQSQAAYRKLERAKKLVEAEKEMLKKESARFLSANPTSQSDKEKKHRSNVTRFPGGVRSDA